MITLPRTVRLREEHDGPDHRYLTARRSWNGQIVIYGQDLGPKTAMVSDDGEYEFTFHIPARSVPLLRKALAVPWHTDVMTDFARRWSGPAAYELDRHLQELERGGHVAIFVH